MEAKRKPTAAQVAHLTEYMQEHPDLAKGSMNSSLDKECVDTQWREVTATLNSMGGVVKSVDKWKQTWRDLKANAKKKALLKHQMSLCDTSVGPNLDISQSAEPAADGENYVPSKKRYVSFDEEIVKLEKEKLELDKEYKAQKIEALSRIASALEELARRKDLG